MQSHRSLEDSDQLLEIVDTFREKRIPVDAVIYLGTGFCPRGWNTPQPSLDFSPIVFAGDPAAVIDQLHDRHVKVVMHIVPWDRDRLPTLQGTIPPRPGETIDDSHIQNYWQQHVALFAAGVDAFWPDEGDWFNLFERIKRHQLYYEGPLSTRSDVRPWSLHRNGYLGIARWGGWVWSGDTDSSWKTLESQIAVGINHSLSLSPYWGTDIGGFFPNEELTGELYARWFQFGAFCPSFRSHGRTWWTRLPWGWGLSDIGPRESQRNPLESELNNPAIEPICKKYGELRYQLLPYNYTLAWQARDTGLPPIRAMWLHYPDDARCRELGNQYLWGRDLLVAPVFKPGATTRDVYLPKGDWYDFWTNEKISGGRTITRPVDLATMPIFVRAGAILPLDRHVLVNHADAAFLRQRDRHRALGHGVHRRAEDRNVDRDAVGEPGADFDLGGHDGAIAWLDEHVVEGQSGAGEFVGQVVGDLFDVSQVHDAATSCSERGRNLVNPVISPMRRAAFKA